MSQALAIVKGAAMEPCRPWPRYVLSAHAWTALAAEPVTLLAAWADTLQVHALFADAASGTVLPVSVAVEAGAYPALSPNRPGAAWYERLIRDLWGHTASGGDVRPWLDHDYWPHTQPLAIRPGPPPRDVEPPTFQEMPGETLMQWPIGPLGQGIGEASHLRLTLDGSRIVRAESRLGYTHKGTLVLMRAKSPRVAARFAARLAGDATVAHSVAFAMATEAALAGEAPPRAVALRTLMAGLERIATHLDDLATLAGLAGAAQLHGRCGLQQEYLRRGMAATFGHRLMMDCVVPGGVAGDADPNGLSALRQALGSLQAEWPIICRLVENGGLAARLTGLGVTRRALVAQLAVSGAAQQASQHAGDAAARCEARLDAIEQDTAAAIARLSDLPEGGLAVALPMNSGEGLGQCASARGDIWHWLRLDHGQIAAVFPRDPGWALWPLAEAALVGAEASDAALICCSLGLPVSGMDL